VPSLDTGLYTDRVSISEELAFARNICNRHGWPIIDVSRRSIEETAAAILALLRTGKNEGFQS
jgi:regulator of PEP synthase PpsR (kinase-PPPase family)